MNNLELAVEDTTVVSNFILYDDYQIWHEYLFNATALISDQIATTYYYCGVISLQTVNAFSDKYAEFDNLTLWIMSFMQNILGNIIAFQKIYDKMMVAIQEENNREIFYQLGRLLNLMLDFE